LGGVRIGRSNRHSSRNNDDSAWTVKEDTMTTRYDSQVPPPVGFATELDRGFGAHPDTTEAPR